MYSDTLVQEEIQANTGRLDEHIAVLDTIGEHNGPPEATLIRRAQSYSDFHDAVKAVLGQDASVQEKEKRRGHENYRDAVIQSDLDFIDWYSGLEEGLLDSSHNDYTWVDFRFYNSEIELKSKLTDMKRLSEAIRPLTIASGLPIIRHDLHAGSLSFVSKLVQGSRSTDYDLSEAMRGSAGRAKEDHGFG